MTRTALPTGVPCAVCLDTITAWTADDRAVPCGHTLDEIGAVWAEAVQELITIDPGEPA